MSREEQIATILQADSSLTAILSGGIFVSGDLGPAGITRDSCPDCFDADGYLLPCAIVKQRGDIPTFEAGDVAGKVTSANQVIELWLYQDTTYTAIDAAKPNIYRLLQGAVLPDSFEIYLSNTLSRQRDTGALQDASMERVDYVVPFVMMPI